MITRDKIPNALEVRDASKTISEVLITAMEEPNMTLPTVQMIQKLKNELNRLEHRNFQAFEALKSKGYYAKTLEELRALFRSQTENIFRTCPTTNAPILLFIVSILDGNKFYYHDFYDITDEEWETAIEFGIFLCRPDVFTQKVDLSFEDCLDECIPYIWLGLLFKHMVNELEHNWHTIQNFQKEKLTLVSDHKKEIDKLKRSLDESKQEVSATLFRAVREAERNARNDERQNQARENKLQEGLIRKQEAEIQKLRSQLKLLSEEKHLVRDVPVTLQNSTSEDFSENTAVNAPDIELPPQGIVIVGGDKALLNRVLKNHPGWTSISSKSVVSIDPSTRLIFVHTKRIGHDLDKRVRAKAPAGAKVILVSRSNINFLEQEMQERYKGILGKVS